MQDTVQRTYIVPASTAAEATSKLQEALPPGRDWFNGLPEVEDPPFELGDTMIVRRGGYYVEGLAEAVFEIEEASNQDTRAGKDEVDSGGDPRPRLYP